MRFQKVLSALGAVLSLGAFKISGCQFCQSQAIQINTFDGQNNLGKYVSL